jgi:hypothetical protein
LNPAITIDECPVEHFGGSVSREAGSKGSFDYADEKD